MFRLLALPFRLLYWLMRMIFQAVILIVAVGGTCWAVIHYTPLDEFYRARALKKVGKYENAVQSYRKGLAAHPNSRWSPQARYELGMTLSELGHTEEAIGHLNQALSVLTDDGIRKLATLKIAESYEEEQNWTQALDNYTHARDAFQTDYGLHAHIVYRSGHCYEQLGNLQEATRCYRLVVRERPTSREAPQAQFAIAQIAERKKDNHEAIKEYKTLVERYSQTDDAVHARKRIAELLLRNKQYKKALDAYIDWLAVAPRAVRWRIDKDDIRKGQEIVEDLKMRLGRDEKTKPITP